MGLIYRGIYDFNVIDELEDGERVYMLDRELGEVRIVNNMTVHELIQTLTTSKKEHTRYQFWKAEETEDEENA